MRRPFRRITAEQAPELGFGAQLTQERLMYADGAFNVKRESAHWWTDIYHYLITMPWVYFLLGALGVFVLLNALFATVYYFIGVEHLAGIELGSALANWLNAYFFSSQTLTTVGYGHISPNGLLANVVASLQSLIGLLSFALVSSLLYGRFARPRARIVFSEHLLVSPYQQGKALMFRMGNASRSELIEAEAQLMLAYNQPDEAGNLRRTYFNLPLEISRIAFFSMSWTLVHALGEKSPIRDFSLQDLLEANAEFLVLVKAMEETNQQMVHTRHSFTASDVVWNARFAPILGRTRQGRPFVLLSKVGAHIPLEDPA